MEAGADLFRSIVEASTDGLWIFDDAGRTLYANDRLAALLGRSPEQMPGFDVRDALDEDGRIQFEEHLADLRRREIGEENVESMLLRADGSAIWTLVSFSPIVDAAGRRTGWLHRVTPYTERKRLVEQLREREAQLASAQRLASLGSWDWDVVSDVVRWSEQLYRMVDLDPAEHDATYGGFLDLVHPEDRPGVRQAVEACWAGSEDLSVDHRVVRRDGEVRRVRTLGRVVRGPDGVPARMSGTTQDLTDLHTAGHLAAEANRRLQLMQGMAMAANETSSLEQAVRMAGAALPHHATGWTAQCVYLLGPSGTLELTDVLGVPQVDPDPVLAEQVRRTGAIAHTAPRRLADTHSLIAIPVSAGGRVVGVIEVLADETPPDENSYRLMTQIAGQLNLVAEREASAAQLAEARDAAMEASRLKSEFLATMSHEIRTPMNGVIGLNDLLLRTDLDDHQRRLAEGLQSAGLTLLAIINDILDLSKIESGKLELETADLDVRAVFEQTAALLSGPAHEKGLELVVACHPDVPALLRGDATRLGQVLANLGSNAVKFTDAGEVSLRARVAESDESTVLLQVDVTDTGIGIAEGARGGLFEAFTQADPSTTRRHGGTGLGLAISEQLVSAMGGRICVDSRLGEGSTFRFTARLERVEDALPRPVSAPDALRGRRALIVDDNATNRFILTEQLAAWDVTTVAVASAAQALTALRGAVWEGRPFDLALLDLVMPGVDGLDLARSIRADPGLAGVALVLLSSDQAVGPTAARAAGFTTALSKPVRHSELYAALAAALSHDEGAGTDPRRREDRPSLGVSVLVVEDNAVNQLVATGLLENLGCRVSVASDGREAVDLLARGHDFAAVLMDCRMPRLDGFDATREIRAQEPAGSRVPIIAMTASALQGERERCLGVGMDDFLTKPVDAVALEKVVRRWTRTRATRRQVTPAPVAVPVPARGATAAAEPAPPGACLPADPGPVLDPTRVRMLEELVKDGVSFFERTALSFLNRIPEQLGAIRDAIDAADAHATLTSAHLVKGSALNLGLPQVAAAAEEIESHARGGSLAGTDRMLRTLTTEIDRAVHALREATASR